MMDDRVIIVAMFGVFFILGVIFAVYVYVDQGYAPGWLDASLFAVWFGFWGLMIAKIVTNDY